MRVWFITGASRGFGALFTRETPQRAHILSKLSAI
jgi:short-subunit dehydrogenase